VDLSYPARRAIAVVVTAFVLGASLFVVALVVAATGWWAGVILVACAVLLWLVPFWWQFFLGEGPTHPWFWLRWWLAPLWRWAGRDERVDGPAPGEESAFHAAPRPHRSLTGETAPPRRW
jgi:hypothetical protein